MICWLLMAHPPEAPQIAIDGCTHPGCLACENPKVKRVRESLRVGANQTNFAICTLIHLSGMSNIAPEALISLARAHYDGAPPGMYASYLRRLAEKGPKEDPE